MTIYAKAGELQNMLIKKDAENLELKEQLEQEKSRSNKFRLSLDDKIKYIEELEDEIKDLKKEKYFLDVCDNCTDCERSIQCKDTY